MVHQSNMTNSPNYTNHIINASHSLVTLAMSIKGKIVGLLHVGVCAAIVQTSAFKKKKNSILRLTLTQVVHVI